MEKQKKNLIKKITPTRLSNIALYYLKRLFSKFDNWKYKGKLATVHPNVDGKIILYSN